MKRAKKENKENRENSEKNIQETAKKFNSEFERIPNNYKDLNDDQKNDVEKFLETCENDDDVQKVHHNMK